MGTGWRLERTFLAGAGMRESRLEGLDLTWSEPFDHAAHAALWADNGTGKTMITALRYALYLPHSRDFIRGESDRSLAMLVRSGNVCHVVEQATRRVDGEVQRIVVGMVAEWPDGGTQDVDNPSRLHRSFYGWLAGEDGPTISDLPFRSDAGRWMTKSKFVDGVGALLPRGGAAPPHHPSDHQGRWGRWLDVAGIDLDQIRFQSVMNATEGGVDRVMRFDDSDEFVRWLIGATMPTSTVEQITNSIATLREHALARPHWEEEFALWEQLIVLLVDLAIAHEAVSSADRHVHTAVAEAATIVADADATTAAQREKHVTARNLWGHHDQARRDAGSAARRAQTHRLRMQLRAADLRVAEAEQQAKTAQSVLREVKQTLDAWKITGDVLAARQVSAELSGLEERAKAADKETNELKAAERRQRRALARLLTHYRDEAADQHRTADRQLTNLVAQLTTKKAALQKSIEKCAATEERLRALESDIATADEVVVTAVDGGLLPAGSDPAEHDQSLAKIITDADEVLAQAKRRLDTIAADERRAEAVRAGAEKRENEARSSADDAQRSVDVVTERAEAVTSDERLTTIVTWDAINPWIERGALNEVLNSAVETADGDARAARTRMVAAQHAIDSVRVDGLLPPAAAVEEAVRRCQEHEVPAWPGWRWLADTMTGEAAAAFATARPDIASGVVVSNADLVGPAVAALGDLTVDAAMWVGTVTDPSIAITDSAGTGGTEGQIVLPPAGVFDRDAAADLIGAAERDHADADAAHAVAARSARDIRAMLAVLSQFWNDLPEDPRDRLGEKIAAERSRQQTATTEREDAVSRLRVLSEQRESARSEQKSADSAFRTASGARVRLAPILAAAEKAAEAGQALPVVRDEVKDLRRRNSTLAAEQTALEAEVESARNDAGDKKRQRDDAADALRRAGLSPSTDGPVPDEDVAVLQARLDGLAEAIEGATADPDLHRRIGRERQNLSGIEARLGLDRELRALADQLADTDGARHPVALAESLREAGDREGAARETYAGARAAVTYAEQARGRLLGEGPDRSSPDVEGYPAAALVTSPDDADQHAEALDRLAVQFLTTERQNLQRATDADLAAQAAQTAVDRIETALRPLRTLADSSLTGQPVTDVSSLCASLADTDDRVRDARQALVDGERRQRQVVDLVRARANGSTARAVEDRADEYLADLIRRLRADERLPSDAERLAGELEQRATSLRDDLDNHDRRVLTSAKMLHLQAVTAIDKLRHYQNQSRLPDGLGEWSERQFVVIDHEPVPADEPVAVDRVARVVHSLLAPRAGRSDAQAMLFAAARALVDAPFRVRLLKPHTDLVLDRVDVAELKNFSGGQRVTAGVLMYATMTRVRASGDSPSIGWLWLDNPFGQASADQFVRTMRLAADRLGLQLVFTAAPKDKGALSMFDRVVALARRSRPSSGEKVVVIDDDTREVAGLTLIQRDVLAVLGE